MNFQKDTFEVLVEDTEPCSRQWENSTLII